MAEGCTKERRELAKRVVAPLEAVDKDQEQRLLHPELVSCIVLAMVVVRTPWAAGLKSKRRTANPTSPFRWHSTSANHPTFNLQPSTSSSNLISAHLQPF
jgi:hypothetical protein